MGIDVPCLVDLQHESSPKILFISLFLNTSLTILVDLQQRSHCRSGGTLKGTVIPLYV